MSRYTITTKSGKQLEDLVMNGSMYVSPIEVAEADLSPEELVSVTIIETEDGNTTETTLENAVCDGILHWPEGWLFNLREQTAEERRQIEQERAIRQMQANIEYVAMMTDVELEG